MFSLQKSILKGVGKDEATFSFVQEGIQDYAYANSLSMTELRKKDSKKRSGNAWEFFCREWVQYNPIKLKMLKGKKIEHVWLLNDVPDEVLELLQLKRHDIGIDLIACLVDVKSKKVYIAIQAKYREPRNVFQPPDNLVPWSQLSTFFGLVSRSGPWHGHIIMTNCKGVTWKVKRTPKDKVLAYQTFLHTPQENWLKMAQITIRRLGDDLKEETKEEGMKEKEKTNNELVRGDKLGTGRDVKQIYREKNEEQMREARLKFFVG